MWTVGDVYTDAPASVTEHPEGWALSTVIPARLIEMELVDGRLCYVARIRVKVPMRGQSEQEAHELAGVDGG